MSDQSNRNTRFHPQSKPSAPESAPSAGNTAKVNIWPLIEPATRDWFIEQRDKILGDGSAPGMDVVAAYSTAISAKRQADALDRIAKALEPQNIDGGSPITVPEHTIRVVDMKPGEAFFAAEIAKRFAAEIAKRALDDFADGWIKRGDHAWETFHAYSLNHLIDVRIGESGNVKRMPLSHVLVQDATGFRLGNNIEAWRPL